MTQASEVPSAERNSPRAVVYLYTQTGQLREVADEFTAPLVASGWDIRWVDVQPRVPFPFPWPIRRFFGAFPAIGGSRCARRAHRAGRWLRNGARGVGDPGLPGVVSRAVASRPVAAEGASRGFPGSQGRLADRVPEHVVLRGDRGGRTASLRGCSVCRGDRRDRHTAAGDNARDHPAMAAGRQARTLPVLRAGRGRRRRTRPGRRRGSTHRRVAKQCSQDAAPIVPTLAAADLLAGKAFRRWGATVRSAARFGAVAQAVSLAIFVVGLGIGIAVGLPVIACAALAGGARFDRRRKCFRAPWHLLRRRSRSTNR